MGTTGFILLGFLLYTCHDLPMHHSKWLGFILVLWVVHKRVNFGGSFAIESELKNESGVGFTKVAITPSILV